MLIQDKLVTKISSYEPKATMANKDGEIVDVIPKSDSQVYLTFEDGSRERVLWLNHKMVDNRKLFTYYPIVDQKKHITSKDMLIAMAAEVVKYEVLT